MKYNIETFRSMRFFRKCHICLKSLSDLGVRKCVKFHHCSVLGMDFWRFQIISYSFNLVSDEMLGFSVKGTVDFPSSSFFYDGVANSSKESNGQ